MADIDEELNSLFDDSSLDEGDLDNFLNMVEDEDSLDLFSEEDDEDESSFVSADLDADEDIDSFSMIDDWDKVSESNTEEAEKKTDLDGAAESSFNDIDNLFTGIDEEGNVPELIPKVTLWQKIKAIFSKKELTEEQRLEKEAEEAEEAEYEERISAQKAEKKKAKSEAKAAAKEEAGRKKEEKKQAKANKAAAKKAEAEKKKQAKAAKKAAAAGGPIPKSQLVPIAPLSAFIIVGIAMAVVVILGSNTRFYSATVKDARELFVHQKYSKAYQNLLGLAIKEKDQEFYDQVETVNYIDDKLSSYYSYIEINRYEEALNSLIEGVREYNKNAQKAADLGLIVEFDEIYNEIVNQLQERFNMGIEEANSMLGMTYSEYKVKIMSTAREAQIADGVIEDPVEYVDETENN